MTVSNLVVSQTYNGNDVLTSFSIPFDFTDNDVIAVYLIEGDTSTKQTLTTEYTLTGGPPVTTVEMVTAPTSDQDLKIVRETPKTQDASLSGTSFPASTIEEQLDNIIRLIQELGEEDSAQLKLAIGSALSDIRLPVEGEGKYFKWNDTKTALENVEAIPTWVALEAYKVGNIVIYGTAIYQCGTAHTSAVWSSEGSYWTAISGPAGTTGAQGQAGVKGDTGPTGATGAAGANGAPGSDGIFAAIASQAEAQAGTDNTKGMTPLRVKEAITSQVPTYAATIAALQAADAALTVADTALSARISTLETVVPSSKYVGSQAILNNQSTPVAILGAAYGVNGLGNGFAVDADGTTHAEFNIRIYREDDGEIRFSTVKYLLHYINGVWYGGRQSTTILAGAMDDGLTFSLVQVGNAAQVYYVSDNMSGGNYKAASRITYVGTEMAVGV